MKLTTVLYMLVIFILGMLSAMALSSNYFIEQPQSSTTTIYAPQNQPESNIIARVIGTPTSDKASPYDWIQEEDITVTKNKVEINIQNAVWAKFTDTNSMDPLIDYGTNAIQVIPRYEADIHIGDIISYQSKYAKGSIIHRVIDINYDKDGWYAIVKGDNNPQPDPGKVRFDQIKSITVAIIY